MPSGALKTCSYPGCIELVSGGTRCQKHLKPIGYYPVLHKRIPVMVNLVYGPPGSGKITFAKQKMNPQDLLIDLDLIKHRLFGSGEAQHVGATKYEATVNKRNQTIESLQHVSNRGQAIWFVVGAPDLEDRNQWIKILQPAHIYRMVCSEETCIQRILASPSKFKDELVNATRRWFEKYEAMAGDIEINFGEQVKNE